MSAAGEGIREGVGNANFFRFSPGAPGWLPNASLTLPILCSGPSEWKGGPWKAPGSMLVAREGIRSFLVIWRVREGVRIGFECYGEMGHYVVF